MPATQAELDALERAIRTGAMMVTYEAGGERRTVHYRSLADMRSARDEIRRELGLVAIHDRMVSTTAIYRRG